MGYENNYLDSPIGPPYRINFGPTYESSERVVFIFFIIIIIFLSEMKKNILKEEKIQKKEEIQEKEKKQ